MTPKETFYLCMGFLDCLEMYAQAAPNPAQASMKRMYVQERMIPDLLPNTPKEEILQMIDEIRKMKPTEKMVLNYIVPKVKMEQMMDTLKQSQFLDQSSLTNLDNIFKSLN